MSPSLAGPLSLASVFRGKKGGREAGRQGVREPGREGVREPESTRNGSELGVARSNGAPDRDWNHALNQHERTNIVTP